MVQIEDLQLKQVMEFGDMDSRRYHLCKLHGVHTLEQLLEYFLEFGTFLGWRHCGQLSNIALINVCKKYSKLEKNVLKLERKAIEFRNRELAFKALESGFVDAIVFTKTTNNHEPGGRLQIQGRVAVCNSFEYF
ncbi:MAG: hypothetical protein K9G41_05030 [Flavobacteriales bacterium]|nr:hypothetical protein [Flavobacteriales bacterium]